MISSILFFQIAARHSSHARQRGLQIQRVGLAGLVSGNFFSTMKIKPLIGRGFLPEEDSVPGRDAVALLSYSEWQRDFGGTPDVLGRAITVKGHPFTIIGVTPEQFVGVQPVIEPELYIPRLFLAEGYSGQDSSSLTNRADRSANLLARLKPDVTVEQANEEVGRISSQLANEHPEINKDVRAAALTQAAYRNAGRRGLSVPLFAIVFLVLAIACVNVSNLLLSTVPARTGEMAVRIALGAPRTRLIRQLLLEGVILSGGGTLVGLWIASWFAAFLSLIRIGSDLTLHFHIQVDERVVIFTLVVGMISAFVSGAIPAWRCSQGDLHSILKSSDPRNRPQKVRMRQVLAAVQVAVTAFVLVFSGWHLKELQLAGAQNPGFRVDHLLTMAFDPASASYNFEKSHAFYNQMLERVRALPGVVSAAVAQDKPFGVINNASTSVTIDGYELPPNRQSIEIRSTLASAGYFETLNIPILRGRAFDGRDRANSSRTVIVNEAMAQQYWPNRDPIGARVVIKEDDGGPAEVIGVARNAKYASMSDPPSMPFLYRSYDQSNEKMCVLLVQTTGSPENLTSAIRAEARAIDRNVPIFDIRTMQEHFRDYGLLEQRISAQIFTGIGMIGLILGTLGLYGVIAYSVGQRTHEIGIRMAVGASGRQVLRMIFLQELALNGGAAAAGISLALALSGATGAAISHASAKDPAIYIAVLLLMTVVTGAASYLPARRASRIDPNITLRS
jgi:predicted permease